MGFYVKDTSEIARIRRNGTGSNDDGATRYFNFLTVTGESNLEIPHEPFNFRYFRA
jgi:hypothetical protein